MIESLKGLDSELLLFFNHLNNSFLDFIFYWISDKWIWVPIYLFLAFKVYKNNPKTFMQSLVFIAIAITISDQISSSVIKPLVSRLRPCNDPLLADNIHLVNNYCGGKFGFVSSHAANVFTLTFFLRTLFGNKNKILIRILICWAIVVSFSRVYLGSHFPGDILCGAILGIAIGILIGKAFLKIIPQN